MVTAADDVYHLEKESHFSSFFDFIGDEPPPQQHWEEDIHSSNNSNTNNEENYLTEEPSTTTNDDEEEVDFGINYFLAAVCTRDRVLLSSITANTQVVTRTTTTTTGRTKDNNS